MAVPYHRRHRGAIQLVHQVVHRQAEVITVLVIIIVIVSIAACFIDRPIKAAMRRSALNQKAARLAALIEKAKEAAALCDDSNLGQQSLRLFNSACECY